MEEFVHHKNAIAVDLYIELTQQHLLSEFRAKKREFV